MNELKKIILFFAFILGIQSNCISQNGYKVISKAEQKFEQGNLDKALKLLNRAEKMDYGFCGNARLEADHLIDSLRSVIHIKNKNYELARASLDSIFWFSERTDIDSIKVRTYQYELGSEYLKNEIDKSLNNSFVDCNEYDCYGITPLKNKESMLKFKIYGDYLAYMFEKNAEKRNLMWIDRFTKSRAYQLIKK